MATTFKNQVIIVGALEDVDAEVKVYKDKTTGEDYNAIVGSYTLAVDDQNINLRCFYKEKNRNGTANQNFAMVKNWLDNIDQYKGQMFRMSSSISSNIFAGRDGNLVEATQIQGNFLNAGKVGNPKAEFSTDILLTSAPIEELKDEEPTGRYILNGRIFDYQDACYPARFIVDTEGAYNYFEGLDANTENPVLVEIWGKVVSNTIRTETKTESAFGDAHVEVFETSRRENVITGAAMEPKDITDELAATIKKGIETQKLRIAAAEERNSNDSKPSGFGSATASKPAAKVGANKAFNF